VRARRLEGPVKELDSLVRIQGLQDV